MPQEIVFAAALTASATHYKAAPQIRCAYCTRPGAPFVADATGTQACALCYLPQHLDRTEIDSEAKLIWLPEMEQAVLNVLVREMHVQLAAMNESLRDNTRPVAETPEVERIWHGRMALLARIVPAEHRLGTGRPSELGQALRRLAPTAKGRQTELLGGLRLLPTGQFFEGGQDIYPAIVDDWCNAPTSPAGV